MGRVESPRAWPNPVVAILAAGFAGSLMLLVAAGREADGVLSGAGFRLDRAMALLVAVVLATATVVVSFATRQLDADGRQRRFVTGIVVLVVASVGVMTTTEGVVLAGCWIIGGLALVDLLGYDRDGAGVGPARRRLRRAAAVGDTALVLAVVLVTLRAPGFLAGEPGAVEVLGGERVLGVPALDLVGVLLVVAGAARSAIVPFHRWLVSTIAAPTPVSAVVHAGFVSGAGILLIRFPDLVIGSTVVAVLAAAAAAVTVVLAAATSRTRSDVKGELAWSTVAQMAFMLLQCAVGAFSSAVLHIAGHGMYKAARFLGAADSVSVATRTRRTAASSRPLPERARFLLCAVVPAGATAIGYLAFEPLLPPAGSVVVTVGAWAAGVGWSTGWYHRAPFAPIATVVTGVGAVTVSTTAYFGGLRIVEVFLKPTIGDAPTAVGSWHVVGLVVMIVLVGAVLRSAPGVGGERIRRAAEQWRDHWAGHRAVEDRAHRRRSPEVEVPLLPTTTGTDASLVRSEVAAAVEIAAPLWPLSSFVAVNPLGGMESMQFDEAAAVAARWLGARAHLPLADYRDDHERGLSRLADLEYAVHERLAELCAGPSVEVEGRLVSVADVVVADLLHGPEGPMVPRTGTQLEALGRADLALLVDAVVADRVSEFLTGHTGAPTGATTDGGFAEHWRRRVIDDARLRRLLPDAVLTWLVELPSDPARTIGAVLVVDGLERSRWTDELRAHVGRLPGWIGLARWRNDWASPDEPVAHITPLDIVALRVALEGAVLVMLGVRPGHRPLSGADTEPDEHGEILERRVTAVASVLAPRGAVRDRETIRRILARYPADLRPSLWLRAQERCFDDRLLSMLDRVDPGSRIDGPDAQMVFCIDVRSEGLRRHVEEQGPVETLGFAGFFGLPMSVRGLGWTRPEARCPVLVSPSLQVAETARPEAVADAAMTVGRRRFVAGLHEGHRGAEHSHGSPFAFAEAAGWVTGPIAARRTLAPGRSTPPPQRTTRLELDGAVLVEQRVFAAEAILRTMGLVERFAPLVVLCGHTSRTVNNAHATALECGACGGASGEDNAMAVAGLLNAPDVRSGLVARGIEIPDATWFCAALHDTASDHVTILDAAAAPSEQYERIDRLRAVLARAGARQAADRSRRLPGDRRRVRDRGNDWAQARPEWGLAGAATMVIASRSLTAGLDLDGRAFLHEYDAANDPTGRVLETIMTAPLIVGHWISSQYYFSTVDPERLGAGDKVLHNPVGTLGVLTGDGVDLRVGLPLQSTHVAGRRHHQPLRLLAVIQADLARVEEIIGRHRILQQLIEGSWIRVAARSHPHEPWAMRSPAGTWNVHPRPLDPGATLGVEGSDRRLTGSAARR